MQDRVWITARVVHMWKKQTYSCFWELKAFLIATPPPPGIQRFITIQLWKWGGKHRGKRPWWRESVETIVGKESTALTREVSGERVSQWLGFTLHFYFVCITCNSRMRVLILFWLHIALHSFSSGYKFCYCMGILKELDEVRAHILLISLLCLCSLNILRALKAGSDK